MGVDAMIESLDLVKQGKAPRIVQNLEEGSYESWFGKKAAELDWTQPAQQVYNVIRAANPQPGAWTTNSGSELKIFNSSLGSGGGNPGEVIAIDDDGIEVAAGNGSIKIARVRADAGKISASEYVEATGLKAGDVLGG